MKARLFSHPVLGMLGAFVLGGCLGGEMTDHGSGMGMNGNHNMMGGTMMNMQDSAMVDSCMKMMSDTAMSGVHSHSH